MSLALKGLVFLYKITIRPIQFSGHILFKITLPLYDIYLIYKRLFIKFYSPIQKKHSLIHPFARRYIIHILIIIMSLMVTTSNLNALEVKKDDTGYTNILASLVQQDEDYETIYEEGPISDTGAVSHYFDIPAVGMQPNTDNDDANELEPDIITNNGALVKPIVSPYESELKRKGEAMEYIVQNGDTISSIAQSFSISQNTILWENNLTAYSIIRPGQKITILPVSGIRHKVLSGDTLGKIAKKYSSDEESVIEFNKLASANDIRVGELLVIPGGKKPQATQTYSLRKLAPPQNIPAESPNLGGSGKLLWPSACKRISQYYNFRHHGVDIACEFGSEIKAADDGIVIKAQGGYNGGYGIMVVIDHGGGKQTLYGHLSKFLVNVGDSVKSGDAVGVEGSTGRSTGPHVHFEIRINGVRVNPLSYIK